MDFKAKLASPSLRDQCEAAISVRSEGTAGVEHLPALLDRCKAIDLTNDMDRHEQSLVEFGAGTLSHIAGEIGFNHDNSLHQEILHWLIRTSSCREIRLAAFAVHGLGSLRVARRESIERLCEIIEAPRRNDENEHLSLRALALRILRRLDQDLAARFVTKPAFDEYLHAVKHWIATNATQNPDTREELAQELAWLTETQTSQPDSS